MVEPLSRLTDRLGVVFADLGRLRRALTHRSAGRLHNERLEFLGDAVLSLHVAERLFAAERGADEGRLTRLRAALVRRETLAEVARELGLGAHLVLGAGELKSGGRDRDSILADALEALIGAVYLDQGNAACTAMLDRLFGERIAGALARPARKDPKTRLQETLQGRGVARPRYVLVEQSGPDHRGVFRVRCEVSALDLSAYGSGDNLRRAEQAGASAVLALLDER